MHLTYRKPLAAYQDPVAINCSYSAALVVTDSLSSFMGVTDLRVLGNKPYNAEPPSLPELTSHPITPLRLVYARNHCTSLAFIMLRV